MKSRIFSGITAIVTAGYLAGCAMQPVNPQTYLASLNNQQVANCMGLSRTAREGFLNGAQPVEFLAMARKVTSSSGASYSTKAHVDRMNRRIAYGAYRYRDLPDSDFNRLMRAECEAVIYS